MLRIAAITSLLLSGSALAGGTPLGSLSNCRHALPKKTDKYVVAECADADVKGLIGRWHKEFVESMGYPDWCVVEGTIKLETTNCRGATEIGYWFFAMPEGARGGGPELHIQLDKQGKAIGAVWKHSR